MKNVDLEQRVCSLEQEVNVLKKAVESFLQVPQETNPSRIEVLVENRFEKFLKDTTEKSISKIIDEMPSCGVEEIAFFFKKERARNPLLHKQNDPVVFRRKFYMYLDTFTENQQRYILTAILYVYGSYPSHRYFKERVLSALSFGESKWGKIIANMAEHILEGHVSLTTSYFIRPESYRARRNLIER